MLRSFLSLLVVLLTLYVGFMLPEMATAIGIMWCLAVMVLTKVVKRVRAGMV